MLAGELSTLIIKWSYWDTIKLMEHYVMSVGILFRIFFDCRLQMKVDMRIKFETSIII